MRYAFCPFHFPENGGKVLWEITSTCNYSCSYCIFSCDHKRNNGELSTMDIFRVIEELKDFNFLYIKFTGGEPFLRTDIIEILTYAKCLGFHMDISTNGSLLSEEIVKQLKDIDIDMVHVSLDGPNKDIHEYVRGRDTYVRTINGIKLLRKHGIYTRLGTVLYKNNEYHIEDMIKKAIELNINEIIFSFMSAAGRLHGNTDILTKRSRREIEIELNGLTEKYKHIIKIKNSFCHEDKTEEAKCPALERFLYINNIGQVFPCSWYQKGVLCKNLKDVSLKEILNSEEVKTIREMLVNNPCPR